MYNQQAVTTPSSPTENLCVLGVLLAMLTLSLLAVLAVYWVRQGCLRWKDKAEQDVSA